MKSYLDAAYNGIPRAKLDDVPMDIFRHVINRYLMRIDIKSLRCTCKILSNIKIPQKHTEKYSTCPICEKRIRAKSKKVNMFNNQNVAAKLSCGCWAHYRCKTAVQYKPGLHDCPYQKIPVKIKIEQKFLPYCASYGGYH